jgi:hypothetical protein
MSADAESQFYPRVGLQILPTLGCQRSAVLHKTMTEYEQAQVFYQPLIQLDYLPCDVRRTTECWHESLV